MRWDHVLDSLQQLLPNTPELIAIYGSNIRQSGEVEYVKPNLLELTVTSDTMAEEIWNPIVIQFDQFCKTIEQLRDSERTLRNMLHHDVPISIFGVFMWSEFLEGFELETPARDGYFGRGLRFRFTPIREEYLRQSP